MMTCSGLTPTLSTASTCAISSSYTSFSTPFAYTEVSASGTLPAAPASQPRQCCTMYRLSGWSATTWGNSASSRPPDTSLMICAPCSSAADATEARVVSMDSMAPSGTNASTAPSTRDFSSSSLTRLAPGRVDSAPMSMMSAPSFIIASPCALAFAGSSHKPPSENESSVMLSTPITKVCSLS